MYNLTKLSFSREFPYSLTSLLPPPPPVRGTPRPRPPRSPPRRRRKSPGRQSPAGRRSQRRGRRKQRRHARLMGEKRIFPFSLWEAGVCNRHAKFVPMQTHLVSCSPHRGKSLGEIRVSKLLFPCLVLDSFLRGRLGACFFVCGAAAGESGIYLCGKKGKEGTIHPFVTKSGRRRRKLHSSSPIYLFQVSLATT